MVPVNPADGVTVTESPDTVTLPWPVSVDVEIIFKALSGKGFASLARTFTVTGFPAAAFGSRSSFATGLGRLEAVTVSW